MSYTIEISDDGFQFDSSVDHDEAVRDVLEILRLLLQQRYECDCVALAAVMEDGTAYVGYRTNALGPPGATGRAIYSPDL